MRHYSTAELSQVPKLFYVALERTIRSVSPHRGMMDWASIRRDTRNQPVLEFTYRTETPDDIMRLPRGLFTRSKGLVSTRG